MSEIMDEIEACEGEEFVLTSLGMDLMNLPSDDTLKKVLEGFDCSSLNGQSIKFRLGAYHLLVVHETNLDKVGRDNFIKLMKDCEEIAFDTAMRIHIRILNRRFELLTN